MLIDYIVDVRVEIIMTPSLKSLLDEVLSLYYRVSLVNLRFRLNVYHKCLGHNAKSHALKVKVSLLEYVGQTAEKPKDLLNKTSHSGNALALSAHDASVSPAVLRRQKLNLPEGQVEDYQNSDFITSPFADYLKSQSGAASSLQMKLKKSIWEHVNLASLCVRRYDNKNAKLHVEIVNSALVQLEEFVSDDEYCELCGLIISRIEELKTVSHNAFVP